MDDDLAVADKVEPVFPWPRPDQTLLGPAEDWTLNACVDYGRGRLDPYIDGYEEAAKLLFEKAVDRDGRGSPDLLSFPILFLWRHVVELRLKQIIWMGKRLRGESSKLRNGHDLASLFGEALAFFEELEAPRDGLAGLKQVIDELSRADRLSDGFRYPVTRDGAPTLTGIPNLVNLGQVHEVMVGVANFLSCTVSEQSARLDCVLEYEAQMRAEMRAEYER